MRNLSFFMIAILVFILCLCNKKNENVSTGDSAKSTSISSSSFFNVSTSSTDKKKEDVTQKISSRTVTFESENTILEATFDYPVSNEKVPAILLVHGWGDIDRDGDSTEWGDIQNFKHFSKIFPEKGIAVFRWDKRGVKKSKGEKNAYSTQTGLLEKDIVKAYQTMLEQKEINQYNILILGQSQGSGLIAKLYPQFESINPPKGMILLSNVVNKENIMTVKCPVIVVNGVYDWNSYITFCTEPIKLHKTTYPQSCYFLAPESDHGGFNMKLGKGVVKHGKEGPYVTHPEAVDAMLDFSLIICGMKARDELKIKGDDGMIIGSSEDALKNPNKYVGKRNQYGWVKDQPPKANSNPLSETDNSGAKPASDCGCNKSQEYSHFAM